MKINSRNILICVILLLVISLTFNILSNIVKNEYYKSIVKENSVQISNNDNDYRKIETILKKYVEYFKNKEYGKIKDSSIFYADKTDNEYDIISNKLNLNKNYEIVIQKIYVLQNSMYKCEIYTNYENVNSEVATISIKINDIDKYFKVLDIQI